MQLLCLLAVAAVVAYGRGGSCPFKNSHSVLATRQSVPFCNVSAIGTNLCACHSTPHCHFGCGCLVPSGTCNSNACGFPRVCLCTDIDGDSSNGSDCSPVDSGPCIDCEETAHKPTHLPPAFAKLLHHEFSLLSDVQVQSRLHKLNLSVSGDRNAKIERLVQYVLAEEQRKL